MGKVKGRTFLLVIAIFAFALIVSIPLAIFQIRRQLQQEYVNNHTFDCPHYGVQSKDTYLQEYTVHKGDTLLSVAKNQLGDVSAVNEIIELNTDTYPEMSLTKPFLEVGWKLYLPKKEWGIKNGKVLAISGNFTKTEIYWGLKTSEWSRIGDFLLTDLKKFDKNGEIKDGSCITVIYQGSLYSDTKIYDVNLQ